MNKKIKKIIKHKYNITGMTCNSCVNKIKERLESFEKITKVEISLEENNLVLSMTEHVQTEILQELLSKAGNYNIKMDTQTVVSSKKQKTNKYKELAPLFILAFLLIIFSTAVTLFFKEDFMFGSRMFMGGFFFVFGLLKILKMKDFASAYAEYDILAKKSRTYALTYPFIELSIGLFYFLNFIPIFVNSITTILMSMGAFGVFLKLRKKEKIQCACMGTVFKVPMTWVTLVENILMAFMAIVMIFIIIN